MTLTRNLFVCFFLLCPFAAGVGAANNPVSRSAHAARSFRQANAVRVETIDFESKLVGAKLPYIVVLPPGYANAAQRNTRYPVIYLLHGLGGNPRNWLNFNLTELAARNSFIFVAPDGRNGFYTDSATTPDDKFESYIMRELIPDVDRRFRTIARREARGVAGLSMGGYGALKFGVKYPTEFAFAGSMSGALAAASYTRAEDLAPSFRSLLVRIFGAADNKTKIENDLFRLVREAPAARREQLPFLYFDCGTEDFLIESNRLFMTALTAQKIPHEYRQLPGAHTRRYWTQQLPEMIDAATRVMMPRAAVSAASTR